MTTLKTEQLGKWNHRMLGNLVLFDDVEGTLVMEEGEFTNFASLQILHNVLLFVFYALVAGYGNPSSAMHDKLYTDAVLSRKRCDQVLYRALRAEGVAKWRAWLFYAGVRLGGSSHYGAK